MTETRTDGMTPTAEELDEIHANYRKGGEEHEMAPHVVYSDTTCPHAGCEQRMQAILLVNLQHQLRAVEDHPVSVEDITPQQNKRLITVRKHLHDDRA